MDGTLLGEDGRVSPRNLAALHAAHAAGVEVVVATGRRHAYAMRILRPLGLHPDCALVSSNGTVTRTLGSATEPTRLIARTHLPHATALWLCEQIRGVGDLDFRNALVLTFDRVGPEGEDTRGALVVEHLEELHVSIGRWMEVNEPYIAHVRPIEDALSGAAGADPSSPNQHAPIQAMLCGTIDRMTRAEARLLQHPGVSASGHPSGRSGAAPSPKPGAPGLAPRSTAVILNEVKDPCIYPSSNPDIPLLTLHRTEYPHRDLSILDILPANCSKGAAILSLAAARGIAPSQIMAIGDNWNDVSMFEAAATAILMDNAPDDLKAHALTRGWRLGSSNRADGVAEAIESAIAIPCP